MTTAAHQVNKVTQTRWYDQILIESKTLLLFKIRLSTSVTEKDQLSISAMGSEVVAASYQAQITWLHLKNTA